MSPPSEAKGSKGRQSDAGILSLDARRLQPQERIRELQEELDKSNAETGYHGDNAMARSGQDTVTHSSEDGRSESASEDGESSGHTCGWGGGDG